MKKVLFIIVALVLVSSCKKSDSESDSVSNVSFSVSDVDKVIFAKSNLQYQASTDTWRFAENSWDYVGNDNKYISTTYSGWIDLFGWGTGIDPTQHSKENSEYLEYNDWGNYCGLSTPAGTMGKWRTLTYKEWNYVLFDRATSSGVRYAKAKVNNINGIVIVPDSWKTSTYSLKNTDDPSVDFEANVISASTWESVLESAGCVFLPTAGWRYGTVVYGVGPDGHYWTSTPHDSDHARYLFFYSRRCELHYYGRSDGFSVRLVADVR